MPIELPRGLPFAVDTWTPASALKRHRFLTHAHRDHLAGITTTSAAGAIYASRLTILIACNIFPQLGPDAFVEMEPGTPMLVSDPEGDFTVTAFDANHCPGAVMFLFEGPFGSVLHTGDCRLTPDCIQGLPLRYITAEGSGAGQSPSCRIDYLFLDCTFAKCPLQFPTKEASIRQVINCIWEHPNAPKVYLVSDMLGQEEILIEVSRAFGSKIYIDRDKSSVCYHTLSHVAPEILTDDASSRFQVIEFPRLSERAEEMLALARARRQPEPLIIRPSSQWYAYYELPESLPKQKLVLTEPMRDEFGVWHVCLSMHSSREELERALWFLRPKWVVSTTPPCLAMELSYVKKHCIGSRLGLDDPLWKLLGISDGNRTTVNGSLQAVPTVEASKNISQEEVTPCVEESSVADCSQVQGEEPTLEDSVIEAEPPVTLFGRARFGLDQDCELWKFEYASVEETDEVKLEAKEQSSGPESSEVLNDSEPDKDVVEVIDLSQVVPKESHESSTHPDLLNDSEHDGNIEVVDITEVEVKELNSSTYSELWKKDEKCDGSANQIEESESEAREQSSIAKAELREVCKPKPRERVVSIEEGKDKPEAVEELSEDCTVVSETVEKSVETAGADSWDGAQLGSSKGLNASLRKLYRSMNVAVPRPLPSLVELMGACKRPRVSSTVHL